MVQAFRISEHKDVRLPIMICQDGFITSHAVENMELLEDEDVRKFVGEYEPEFILDMLPFKGAIQGDVAIKETGDSMSPRIPSGAIMLLRRVMEWQEYFGYGHVFVLVLTDGRRITKRVTKCIENPREYVLCESINPAYPSEELPKKMIYSVWKVIDVLVHEGY